MQRVPPTPRRLGRTITGKRVAATMFASRLRGRRFSRNTSEGVSLEHLNCIAATSTRCSHYGLAITRQLTDFTCLSPHLGGSSAYDIGAHREGRGARLRCVMMIAA